MKKNESFRRKKAKLRNHRRNYLDLDNIFFNFLFPEYEAKSYHEHKKSKIGQKLNILRHEGY